MTTIPITNIVITIVPNSGIATTFMFSRIVSTLTFPSDTEASFFIVS